MTMRAVLRRSSMSIALNFLDYTGMPINILLLRSKETRSNVGDFKGRAKTKPLRTWRYWRRQMRNRKTTAPQPGFMCHSPGLRISTVASARFEISSQSDLKTRSRNEANIIPTVVTVFFSSRYRDPFWEMGAEPVEIDIRRESPTKWAKLLVVNLRLGDSVGFVPRTWIGQGSTARF